MAEVQSVSRGHSEYSEQSSERAVIRDRLLEKDNGAASWREKLAMLLSLMKEAKGKLRLDALADMAVYLRFLGTGQASCEEDGRHFRPSHHARLANEIRDRLAVGANDPERYFLIRKIIPWLPSGTTDFTRAEPLTRIRDIAHRNDVPRELKEEIKHTLQNKLHRCAGPEDLLTANRLLARISAPDADYATGFVEQFKIFHDELREFFNARSLEDRLTALESISAPETVMFIQSFVDAKTGSTETIVSRVELFRRLTALRGQLIHSLLETDNSGWNEILLADIGLEDFAFVVVTGILNLLPLPLEDFHRNLVLDCLYAGELNLGLSGIDPEENEILASELSVWSADICWRDRNQLLRLKATLERGLRCADRHSRRMIELFGGRAERLGMAMGVPKHAIDIFCESELRGSLMFPFSRLIGIILKDVREILDLPPWEVLVPGSAQGRVVAAESLNQISIPTGEPGIVLLSHANGDEEIPAGVCGIVLSHSMPHLSHLGVRARQSNVVFVAEADEELLGRCRALLGQQARMSVSPDSVTVDAASDAAAGGEKAATERRIEIPEPDLGSSEWLLPISRVTLQNAGAKAEGARRLEKLSGRDGRHFETPVSYCIPFGVFHRVLTDKPEFREQIGRLSEAERFRGATLPNPIAKLSIPAGLMGAVQSAFGESKYLMVRSSCNCEDLANFAEAGLYESVPNVVPNRIDEAIRKVWSSLWSEPAISSRARSGIPHSSAHMAILVQELVRPDFSFILHTVNPINGNAGEVYVEIVVGLGDALASGAVRGTPYRMTVKKTTGEIRMLAFANFSRAFLPDDAGGVTGQIVDYSTIDFSLDRALRERMARKLTDVAASVENEFGGPQDIEGVIQKGTIWLVQARAQQGLSI